MTSASAHLGRPRILGVPVDAAGGEVVRSRIRQWLCDVHQQHCSHIVTLNPEYVMLARRNRAFAQAVEHADLITADGFGITIALRLLGSATSQAFDRVTGVDLLEWLAAESATCNAPLFLLGAGPGVAQRAAERLMQLHPGARIAGWWAEGTPASEDDAESLERIGKSGARAVAVAYGAPGQVLWISRNQTALGDLGVRVAIGVGGALDFVAGVTPRAPRWMRAAGLEWLYRLVRQPWRWRRQLVLPLFALAVIREWLVRLWRRGNRPGKYARPK